MTAPPITDEKKKFEAQTGGNPTSQPPVTSEAGRFQEHLKETQNPSASPGPSQPPIKTSEQQEEKKEAEEQQDQTKQPEKKQDAQPPEDETLQKQEAQNSEETDQEKSESAETTYQEHYHTHIPEGHTALQKDVHQEMSKTMKGWQKEQLKNHLGSKKKEAKEVKEAMEEWKRANPEANRLQQWLARQRFRRRETKKFLRSDAFKSARSNYIKNHLLEASEKNLQRRYLFQGKIIKAMIFINSPEMAQIRIQNEMRMAAQELHPHDIRTQQKMLTGKSEEAKAFRQRILDEHLANLLEKDPRAHRRLINNKKFIQMYSRHLGYKLPPTQFQQLLLKATAPMREQIRLRFINRVQKRIQTRIVQPANSIVENRFRTPVRKAAVRTQEFTSRLLGPASTNGINALIKARELQELPSVKIRAARAAGRKVIGKIEHKLEGTFLRWFGKRVALQIIIQLIVLVVGFIADVIFTIGQGGSGIGQ